MKRFGTVTIICIVLAVINIALSIKNGIDWLTVASLVCTAILVGYELKEVSNKK